MFRYAVGDTLAGFIKFLVVVYCLSAVKRNISIETMSDEKEA